MATYAIGDIQGCMRTLQALLNAIAFDPTRDRLMLVGDLVNRGADSLATLRWAYAHRASIDMVLGNHELALLAYAHGVRKSRPLDTLDPILQAPDADTLLHWLTHLPLALFRNDHLMVHAGVLPHWSTKDVLARAQDAQQVLQGPQCRNVLAGLQTPGPGDEALQETLVTVRALTYLRVLDAQGLPVYAFRGTAQDVPKTCTPWFAAASRATASTRILCGHWAALGLHVGDNIRALDTGCVWGGPLTALCLETDALIAVPCIEKVVCRPNTSD